MFHGGLVKPHLGSLHASLNKCSTRFYVAGPVFPSALEVSTTNFIETSKFFLVRPPAPAGKLAGNASANDDS
jgi:hypothetical protein